MAKCGGKSKSKSGTGTGKKGKELVLFVLSKP